MDSFKDRKFAGTVTQVAPLSTVYAMLVSGAPPVEPLVMFTVSAPLPASMPVMVGASGATAAISNDTGVDVAGS